MRSIALIILCLISLVIVGCFFWGSEEETPKPVGDAIVTPVPAANVTPTQQVLIQQDIEESYCFWPGDTLFDVANYAGVDTTKLQALNPDFTGHAGSRLRLPIGSIAPGQWTHPLPKFNAITDLPFGVSGYYISYDNRQKRVALTFDVGFVPENKAQMEWLAARGIRATYFVVGESVARHPEMIEDILKNGHELANHSYTHENMQRLPAQTVGAELRVTEKAVKRANVNATTKPLFRAPFGAINQTIIDVAQQEGYYVVGWTVDSSDWNEGITAEIIYRRVTQNVCPGAIIVMHDVNPANHAALPRIIDFLNSNGYAIVPVSELLFPKN